MSDFSLDRTTIATIAGFGVLGGIWLAIGPGYVSRGPIQNIVLTFVGTTYGAKVRCGAPVKTTMAEGFLGMGAGKHFQVKAYSRRDAREAVESAFPTCDVSHVQRQSRSGRKSIQL